MANVELSFASCGMSELSGFKNAPPEESIRDVYDYMVGNNWREGCGYIIFSDTTTRGRDTSGYVLARYIQKNNLGSATQVPGKKNPNTGNRITVWVWNVNHRNLKSLGRKEGWNEEKEIGRDLYPGTGFF